MIFTIYFLTLYMDRITSECLSKYVEYRLQNNIPTIYTVGYATFLSL